MQMLLMVGRAVARPTRLSTTLPRQPLAFQCVRIAVPNHDETSHGTLYSAPVGAYFQ